MTPGDNDEEANAPIEIYAGDSTMDGGIAAVPKMLLRFARHLECSGSQLNDRQVLLLVMVIALREDRNLRLGNLPMTAAISTLETDLALLRKAGLVLTERDYYPARNGQPPRMRSQIWDIRSLNANLAHVQQLWFKQQARLTSEWRTRGERGASPIYVFPSTFRHKVVIPRAVLEDMAAGRFFPVPDKWLKLTHATFSSEETAALKSRLATLKLPTASNTAGRDAAPAPTASFTGNRGLPTASKTGGHLLTSSPPLPEQQLSLSDDDVFVHFATRKGQEYKPTGADRKTLKSLHDAGYTQAQIITAIDEVFDRGDNPKRFTYCAQIVQDCPPACPPAASTEPTRPPEDVTVLSPELEPFVELLADGDLPVLRRRLKILADSCEIAAKQHRASGPQWLRDALERSLGKADPLTYAAAILRSWAAHGPNANLRLRPERQPLPTWQTRSETQADRSTWNDSIDA